jgi:thiol:disulfide interchange protein
VERVNELAAEGKTIFVDFTADWCLTCKVNERTVLSTEAVAEAFREYEVEALLADYTRRQPEITRILQSFGRAGVPMYVIFPGGRPEDVMLLPEVLTPGLVIEKLAEAAGGKKIAGTL